MRIGDIGSGDAKFAAVLFAQCIDALLYGIAGDAPAGQHHMLGAVRSQVAGDLQSQRTQSAGNQICRVRAELQRRTAWPLSRPNQPRHVEALFTQRDLVFPEGLVVRRGDLAEKPRPFVGGAF